MGKDELVYSTGKGAIKKQKAKSSLALPQPGPCKMRLEKSGRGGKQVTILFNLPFSEAEAKALMKSLQAQLACGATFKGGMLQFSGDVRDKIAAHFAQENMRLVRAGG